MTIIDLEQLYRENYHIVRGYVLSLCGDEHLADDIASETFLKAIRNAKSYDQTCRPSTWLCSIAKNLCYDEFRRQKNLTAIEELDIPSFFNLEQYIVNRTEARKIVELALRLKPDIRQVFFMRIQGLDFKEIGAALGRTDTWARVTYFRTKNKIFEEMEERT